MAKKLNPWMAHVQAVRKQNPGMSLMEILKKAKTSYKKPQHGGSGALGGSLSPSSVPAGGRSSGTALQMQAIQFSGGKKSKRRGSKRRGSKRRGSKRRSRGGMPSLTPGDLKRAEFL
jgi:hypothetical protein